MIEVLANNYEGTKGNILPIAYMDENIGRTIIFDLNEFKNAYGEGTWSIRVKRPTETTAYFAQHTWESAEGDACWDVDEIDSAIEGIGEVQLTYYPANTVYGDDERGKTKIWLTQIKRSIVNMGELPPETPSLLDQIVVNASKAEASVSKAAEQANRSSAYANASEASAALSKQYMENAYHVTPEGFPELVEDVVTLKEDFTALDKKKANNSDLAVLSAEVTNLANLYKGQDYDAVTETQTSYVHELPTNHEVQPKGFVSMIGGMTQKWNQLVPTSKIEVTTTINEDVTVSAMWGKTICYLEQKDCIVGDVYIGFVFSPSEFLSVSWGANTNSIANGGSGSIAYSNTSKPYELTASIAGTTRELAFRLLSGLKKGTYKVSIYLINLTKLFGKGSEPTSETDPRIAWIEQYALDHPQYDEGSLKSGLVEEVVSMNDLSIISDEQKKWIFDNRDSLIDNKTMLAYYASEKNIYAFTPDGQYYKATQCREDGLIIYMPTITADYARVVYQTGVRSGWTVLYSHNGYVDKDLVFETKLNEKLLELDGYGLGINDTCYNYVSTIKEKFYNMRKVDFDNITWSTASNPSKHFFVFYNGENNMNAVFPTTSAIPFNAISNEFYPIDHNSITFDKDKAMALASDGRFMFVDFRFNTLDAFAEHMKSVGMWYESTAEDAEDIERYLYRQYCDEEDFENMSWSPYPSKTDENNSILKASVVGIKPSYIDFLCDKFTPHQITYTGLKLGEMRGDTVGNFVYVCVQNDSTQVVGKIVYQLESPRILDVTDLVDPIICDLESGGTVTFVNENKIAVPHTLNYCIKL